MEVTMLTELFPVAHRRYTASPAAPWLSGFAEWLSTQGYSRKAMRGHVLRLRQALERTRSFSPEVQSSSKQFSKLFIFPTRQAQYRATEHNFRRYLTASSRLSPQPEPEFGRFTPLLVAYRRYLLDVRARTPNRAKHAGLSPVADRELA
jgi:integrase/recombinase XerD